MQFEHAPPEARQLLPRRIRDLGLSLENSPVAPYVRRLYEELEAAGLKHFKPLCYLSDEWGSPSGEPVIGIPLYLGDPRVAHLEDEINDVETGHEVMMFLRHEAGHAFNHAWELHRSREWHQLFGSSRRRYRDDYRFIPFSHEYVRHIAGWYAQKHPDEDFAETFAVWLDPESRWRERYDGWGAMRKLLYVDRMAREKGDEPTPRIGNTDITVEEMDQTVAEYFESYHVDETPAIESLALDVDLTDIFRGGARNPEARAAAELLAEHRRVLVDKVHHWTGVRRTLVRALVLAVEKRLAELQLRTIPEKSRQQMLELTVYITSLAMTFLMGKRPLRHRSRR